MSVYSKGNITLVVENISAIQEDVNGKNYVTLTNGVTINVSDEDVEAIKSKINSSTAGAMLYQSTVENYSDLPATATVGDIYQVSSESKFYIYGSDGKWSLCAAYTNISSMLSRINLEDTKGFWLWCFTDANGKVTYGQNINGEIVNYLDPLIDAEYTEEEDTPATASLLSSASPLMATSLSADNSAVDTTGESEVNNE